MAVVAVVGAGKLGGAVARRALAAGHVVRVVGRVDDDAHRARVAVLAPGAQALGLEAGVAGADLVVLALPLPEHARLDPALLVGRVVVDATNDWPVTGPGATGRPRDSSVRVQRHLAGAALVKALNHVGYHDLDDEPLHGSDPRRALAVAGDDRAAVSTVAAFLDSLGFDAVDAGSLEQGAAFAVGSEAFSGWWDAGSLQQLLRGRSQDRRPELVAA